MCRTGCSSANRLVSDPVFPSLLRSTQIDPGTCSRGVKLMVELNILTAIPYNLELRDTISAALYRLEQLKASAAEVVRLDEQLDAQALTREGLNYDVLQVK